MTLERALTDGFGWHAHTLAVCVLKFPFKDTMEGMKYEMENWESAYSKFKVFHENADLKVMRRSPPHDLLIFSMYFLQ